MAGILSSVEPGYWQVDIARVSLRIESNPYRTGSGGKVCVRKGSRHNGFMVKKVRKQIGIEGDV